MNIKKENLQKAYDNGCDTTKKILKDLFPDMFEKESKYFDLSELSESLSLFDEVKSKKAGFYNGGFLEIRGVGEYRNKAFYLSTCYHWEIKKDKDGTRCLIPTKK